MLERSLRILARGLVESPRRFVAAILFLTLPLGIYASGLRVSTSRAALVSETEPHWQRYLAFANEFGIPEDLVVVAEGPDARARGRFVDRTAQLLMELGPAAGAPFAKVPVELLEAGAVYARPTPELLQWTTIGTSTAARRLVQATSLATALEATAQLFEHSAALIQLPEGVTSSAARGLAAGLGALVRAAQGGSSAWPTIPALQPPSLDAEGHFLAGPQRTLLIVRPPYTRDDIDQVSAFLTLVRRAADQAQAETQVTYGLTGLPAMMLDELETIQHDSALTTILSLIGVLSLFWAFFPSLRILGISILPVLLGVVWTAAGIRALYGHLNLMSSIFLVVIVGMGIDFSVHLGARQAHEMRRGRSPKDAAMIAVERTGRGLLTGAITSAGAFSTLLLARFQGIEELGGAAALGLVVTLILAMLLVPALGAATGAFAIEGRTSFGTPTLLAWARRAPRRVLLVALLISGPALYGAIRTRFDFSLVALLPEDSQSGRLMTELLGEPSFTAQALVLLAADRAEATHLTAAAQGVVGVREVHSATQFLPVDADEKWLHLSRLSRAWSEPLPSSPVTMEQALRHLEAAVAHAGELAFRDQRLGLLAPLEQALGHLEDLRAATSGPARDSIEKNLAALDEPLARQASSLRARVIALGLRPPPSVELLPDALLRRFVSPSGRYAIYVVPEASLWDRPAMGEVLAELRTLGPVTGFPETFYENSGLIRDGFLRAAGWSLLVVFLLAFADLRRPRDVLLSLLPVVLGGLWMLGVLPAFGLSYNLANVVGVPLIAGVAIDGGVHLLHRYRESGDLEEAVLGTGAAVMLSSLTTMVGFGSLAFASHRGYQSLGLILFVGVGASLVVTMFVLPALLCLGDRR